MVINIMTTLCCVLRDRNGAVNTMVGMQLMESVANAIYRIASAQNSPNSRLSTFDAHFLHLES